MGPILGQVSDSGHELDVGNPTVLVVHLVDPARVLPKADDFVVGFIPAGESGKLWPGEVGERAEVDAVHIKRGEPQYDHARHHDSAYEDEDVRSVWSESITSSVVDYEYQNGRRYCGYRRGAYPLPNDEEEQDRLDLLHHIFRLALHGSLVSAPIGPTPQRVLDVGTGTGIWAMEFSDEFPSAQVIGTDISPIQPSWVPPNTKFYIDDAESEWVYRPDEAFDYIHCRGMGGSIKDWDKLCAQCYTHVKPGGWVEFQEPEAWFRSDDNTKDRVPFVNQWQTLCNDAAKQFGKEIDLAPTHKQRMIDAGFVDVREQIVKIPLGPWTKDPHFKELGWYQLLHATLGIEPYALAFICNILGWSEDECRVLVAKTLEELRNRQNHLYVRFYFLSGSRPP
ncbi:methyltransferase [Coleophoma cylindrospora]|uniref:Methyltransferase n=1 Tax=Coleophoma cylindrospora TaxID=1849047 RepID=A0A3D8SE85_9HELO|nr:methyltransferase [Coleophoma cylindrospora]